MELCATEQDASPMEELRTLTRNPTAEAVWDPAGLVLPLCNRGAPSAGQAAADSAPSTPTVLMGVAAGPPCSAPSVLQAQPAMPQFVTLVPWPGAQVQQMGPGLAGGMQGLEPLPVAAHAVQGMQTSPQQQIIVVAVPVQQPPADQTHQGSWGLAGPVMMPGVCGGHVQMPLTAPSGDFSGALAQGAILGVPQMRVVQQGSALGPGPQLCAVPLSSPPKAGSAFTPAHQLQFAQAAADSLASCGAGLGSPDSVG